MSHSGVAVGVAVQVRHIRHYLKFDKLCRTRRALGAFKKIAPAVGLLSPVAPGCREKGKKKTGMPMFRSIEAMVARAVPRIRYDWTKVLCVSVIVIDTHNGHLFCFFDTLGLNPWTVRSVISRFFPPTDIILTLT